jgi:hypothetical protein
VIDLGPLKRWCAGNPQVVLYDENSATLIDLFSSKPLKLEMPRIQDFVEKTASDTGEGYLLIVYDDGRQLALAQAGIAWPPDPRNLPVPLALPPVVCWRDFHNVANQAGHVVEAHPDEPPSREVLHMLLYCIALLDGARAIGFETAREEQRIEGYLDRVERA